ncbi:MAG: discoidin domain-containing protein [Planctomycetota bacterium]|nr:discoidin domain-containing protein [Planctomycetota bacterium]MDA1212793.1 discoidin domain-containing protein [Planctomycetota bacterium]
MAGLLVVLFTQGGPAWFGDRAVAANVPAKTEVETSKASPLGLTAMTVNGRIQPHELPTRYWFEYGTSTEYGSTTTKQNLPPKLAAYYHESWNSGIAGWQGGMTGTDLVHHDSGGSTGGFVRFSEPSGDDPNHVDGIGTLHLTSYFYPGSHPNSDGQLVNFTGGDPDFRDARVSLAVRGNEFHPNGAEFCWWTQSENDITQQFTPDWRRANWAYTGFTLTDALRSGEWEHVTYRLTNDSHAWTYGGNNLAQLRPNYEYASINHSLGHVTCDFFHLLAFVDPSNRPVGSIDIDEFELAYRNYSLVHPANGGKLIASPTGGGEPSRLTDGWRNGQDKMWESSENPDHPQEFVYEFDRPVTVNIVQIHQHTDWPSREIEVMTSQDGMTWKSLTTGEIATNSTAGPGFVYFLQKDLNAEAQYVKVRILSGYQPECWGLGEIELFGTGAEYTTDDDWYHVNLDVDELAPGQTYHFRLVAENELGTTYGDDVEFTIPADAKPHVVTGAAKRLAGSSATVTGRLTPLGKKTVFYFEYGTNTRYGNSTSPQYGGLQMTPRLAFAAIDGLKPGTTYHYRLVAENESGVTIGDDATFETVSE